MSSDLVRFTFDGTPLEASRGMTIGGALLANGIVSWRRTRADDRPRGIFCGIGVCFDCGHAHMMGGIPEAFATLKKHICSTHVHDNNKEKDSHLWPGTGSIDWKETMELLRTAPQTPPLLLEIEGEEKKNSVEDVSATFRKLEEA